MRSLGEPPLDPPDDEAGLCPQCETPWEQDADEDGVVNYCPNPRCPLPQFACERCEDRGWVNVQPGARQVDSERLFRQAKPARCPVAVL